MLSIHAVKLKIKMLVYVLPNFDDSPTAVEISSRETAFSETYVS